MTVEGQVLDDVALRQAFGCVPSGVVMVAAQIDDEPVGLVASTFVPVSLDPPLVAFCVQNKSTTWPRLRSAYRLGLSVFGADHDQTARQVAGSAGRFDGLELSDTPDGAVLLAEGIALFECSIQQDILAGDHAIIVLQVHRIVARRDQEPLVFHASVFKRLGR